MAFHYSFFLILLLLSLSTTSHSTVTNQSQFFTLMKNSLRGNPLSDWDVTTPKPFCNYAGISCNEHGFLVKIDFSGWSLSGRFPEDVCSYLPELRILRLGYNDLHGNFPQSISDCSLLEELNMSYAYLTGTLPDFSSMAALRSLDLSYNLFTGDFLVSITNLTNLEKLGCPHKEEDIMMSEVHLGCPPNLSGPQISRVIFSPPPVEPVDRKYMDAFKDEAPSTHPGSNSEYNHMIPFLFFSLFSTHTTYRIYIPPHDPHHSSH
ncbi:hypothetical protein CsSME_00000534 [Camellia sinensis var. sinensis]